MKLKFTALFFSVMFTASALPALAFPGENMRCEVKRTNDGFVALRRGPSAKTQLLLKLKNPIGRSVYVDNVFPTKRTNGWIKVDAFRYDTRFAEDDDRSVAWSGSGYIRANLIDWSSCNNAG